MSWGPATVYVHRRLGLDGSPYGGFSLDAWKRSPLFNRPRTISRPLLELTRCVASEVSPGTLIRCIYHVRKPIKASIGEVTPSELKYLFRAPKDFNVTNYKHRSLVVFLHGASARGDTFEAHEKMALPSALHGLESTGIISTGDQFLFVAPLCPSGMEWKSAHMSKAVLQLIDDLCANLDVDLTRLHLTGISMGGLGSWIIAARAPYGKFASLAPMCGGGSVVYARLLRDTPIWFFHSVEDNVIGVEETDALHEALLKEGSKVAKYTRYASSPEPAAQPWMVGHNVWTKTYQMPEFSTWFLGQRSRSNSLHSLI